MRGDLDDRTVLIGLDVGTTNVKALAYDLGGRPLASASSRHDVLRPRPGWAEYDAEAMFSSAAAAVREVVEYLTDDARIAGIAVSSMAETAVALDADGKALRPAIAWHDERTTAQAEWWHHEVGDDVVARISGLPNVPIFGIHKLLWIRDEEPETFARLRRWLNVADYVAYRLSGVQATDHTLASRLMVLDLSTMHWSEPLLSACGIDADLFAELVPSGTAVGSVHAEGHAASGLPVGTNVVAGGMDHPCAALALGITRPGDILDSLGTSESIFSVLSAPRLDPELTRAGYQQGPHVVPGLFYCNGGMYTAGACLDWARATLFAESDGYGPMVAAASAVPIGSEGVAFLPHMRMANTPINDGRSRGAFVGLSIDTGRGHLARAVIEGVAFGGRASFDGLVDRLGLSVERVRAVGGVTRNAVLMSAKAALLPNDVALEIAELDEASSLGAALLAGIGAGVYADAQEAAAATALATTTVEPPPPAERAAYERMYANVYQRLYPQVAPLSHAIVDLAS